MREWSDSFNSFNSMKGLLYRKWMEGILAGEFLPPVEASIDPVYDCNLSCRWCNSGRIFNDPCQKGKMMTRDHLLNLCRFLAMWGVKGVCFAGGGEPFLHPDVAEATDLLGGLHVETAFLTNGTLINDRDILAMVRHSRWVGCSVDAASPDTYAALKGGSPGLFSRVLDFLKEAVARRNKAGSKLEISFKFLVHPANAGEILDAVRLARSLGVDYAHIRPAASENVLGGEDACLDFPLAQIDRQMQEAFNLETDTFKVYGVRHKFNPSFHKKRHFKSCLSAPLLINLGPDGNAYLCVDHRGKQEYAFGRHDPDPEELLILWGSPAHKALMSQVDVGRCPRCTFGPYNEVMEKAIVEDRMCKNFP
jgi:molybdenum cofactor biosynthesis enzyme MoaA